MTPMSSSNSTRAKYRSSVTALPSSLHKKFSIKPKNVLKMKTEKLTVADDDVSSLASE